jgi:hypothetical protein
MEWRIALCNLFASKTIDGPWRRQDLFERHASFSGQFGTRRDAGGADSLMGCEADGTSAEPKRI